MNTPKKIPEPGNTEELLRFWLLHAHKGRDRHDRAARHYDRIRNWLGGSATVLSAVVGTSVFTALSDKPSNTQIQISVGSIAVLSAILTGLGSYLNLAERVEKHRFAGIKYKEAVRELERLLSVSVVNLSNADSSVTQFRDRFDQLEESAPVVPERIYARIEEQWKTDSFVFVDKAEALYQMQKA
jgi:hypothetical protein